MSAVIATEKHRISNLVKDEFWMKHGWCRSKVTVNVASATDLSVGSVLGKVTADGKYKPRDPAAATGEEVSAAVVIENISVPATTDTEVVVLVNGPAILAEEALVFDVTHTSGEQETAISELAALDLKTKKQLV